jgi:hypothetical protein
MLATLVKALAEGGYDQDFRLLADKASATALGTREGTNP